MSIHQLIRKKIEQSPQGHVLFTTDFRDLGSDDAIRQSLSRLNKEKIIERIAQGIYYIPKHHRLFGKLQPGMEEIAEAVAKHEHIRIKPAGAYALNKLGLSTQVPTKLVYITDGQAKQISIGKGTIKFKPVSPKKFGLKGPISSLVIQALEDIKSNQLMPQMEEQIRELLKKEDRDLLIQDLKLAPAKINKLVMDLLKSTKNDD